MRVSFEQDNRQQIKQQIKQLLDEASQQVPVEATCPNCGRAMQQARTTFGLFGSDLSWNISLPFCDCKREKERAAA